MFNKYSTFQLWRTFLLRDAALNNFSWLNINIDILELFNTGFLDDFFDKNQDKKNIQKKEILEQLINWNQWGEVDLKKTDTQKINLLDNKFNLDNFKSISLNFFFQNKPINPNPVGLSFSDVCFETKNNNYIFIKQENTNLDTVPRFHLPWISSGVALTINLEFYDKYLVIYCSNRNNDSESPNGKVIKIIPIFLFEQMFPFQGRTNNLFHLMNSEPWYFMSNLQKKFPKLFDNENIANDYIRSVPWFDKIGFDISLETIPTDFFEELESRLKKQFGEKYWEVKEKQISELLSELDLQCGNDSIFKSIEDKIGYLRIMY